MPHYPCNDCCDEFTPTCSPEEFDSCFPQAIEDTEFSVTIPSFSGANPACADIAGDYVLTWELAIDGWSYVEEDFFGAGTDLRINLHISCVDSQCYMILTLLIPGPILGAAWASDDPISSSFPIEVAFTVGKDVSFPCDLDAMASAYITAITGF